MNRFREGIQEDAKSDWMKIVNKHKKKQKGLPALSTLNTNAGNVEHNINMFNMMQSEGNVTVDASNGNISTGDSCCESYAMEETIMNNTIVEDEYFPDDDFDEEVQTIQEALSDLDDQFDMSMRMLL